MSDDYECGDYQSGEDRKVSNLPHHNRMDGEGMSKNKCTCNPKLSYQHRCDIRRSYRREAGSDNMNCLNCGGLIPEPGVAYAYAGKVCYCPKDPAHIYQRPSNKLPGYTSWNLKSHRFGKVYDLSQANMNAMIADIEALVAALKGDTK